MTDPVVDTGVESKWRKLGNAIDQVLLADNQQQHWLGDDHLPFAATMQEALKTYGPGVKFDLWCNCRAAYNLRQLWVGVLVDGHS